MAELETGQGRYRSLTGFPGAVGKTFLAAITIVGAAWALGLHYQLGLVLFKEQFLAVMFALGLAATFVITKPTLSARSNRLAWIDWIGVGLSLLVGGYVAIGYPTLSADSASLAPQRWILGFVAL